MTDSNANRHESGDRSRGRGDARGPRRGSGGFRGQGGRPSGPRKGPRSGSDDRSPYRRREDGADGGRGPRSGKPGGRDGSRKPYDRDGRGPARGRGGDSRGKGRDGGDRFRSDRPRGDKPFRQGPGKPAPSRGGEDARRDNRREDARPRRSDDVRQAADAASEAAERTPTGFAGRPDRPRKQRSRATPARLAALGAVRTIRERDAYAQDVIGKDIDRSALSPEDRAFATRLVLGVVSASGTLDDIINRMLEDPRDISPQVRDALRISAYEIMFLDKIYHAAVDQGVELVKSVAPPAAGVANFVLRSIVRMRSEFPFGDPTQDVEALARLHAFPAWMAILLMSDLGPETSIAFMRASNEPAPLFIAVNEAKTREDLVRRVFDRLEEPIERVSVDEGEVPGCLRVDEPRTLLLPDVKRLINQGRILVSDAASQHIAASVLPDEMPKSFLEVGAGRATKTILIQSDACRRWGKQIEDYVTLDNHAFKTSILRERTEKYGIHVAESVTGDVLAIDELMPGRRFDEVFLDAPCSGLGTLRRHPEIRWRLKPEDVVEAARTQLAMLKALAGHVEVGGTLAYATCSVTHMENNSVAKAFLESDEGAAFRLAPIAGKACIATRLDVDGPDAHFAVRFVRVAEDEPKRAPEAAEVDDAACETAAGEAVDVDEATVETVTEAVEAATDEAASDANDAATEPLEAAAETKASLVDAAADEVIEAEPKA
ncbi:rRNA methyltransferase [Eggerthellaceae bacterium zg-893]|nr:rRNA methyltransferase [Eggerthellaceae bacterium zg-893]